MSLLPRWFNRLPSPSRGWKGDLSKIFAEEEKDWFGIQGLSVYSDDNSVTIEADVPGLTSKDVDVSLDQDGVLWIKGERKFEEKKDKNYYRKSQQSFSYCLPLGDEIDFSEEPKAACKDGVMKITFAKRKEKQKESKKIPVKD